ncbi:MAG TPA: cysteine-rich CWC family protein [Thermoleophilaceae bacterium]|nr:cysteine-rich CWC family protein [Thermoleophilaceae bacterium]
MSAEGDVPAPRCCAHCGEPFGCGAGTGSCWCAAVDVSAEALDRLAARYDGCLCPSCLRAAGGTLRDVSAERGDAANATPPA